MYVCVYIYIYIDLHIYIHIRGGGRRGRRRRRQGEGRRREMREVFAGGLRRACVGAKCYAPNRVIGLDITKVNFH